MQMNNIPRIHGGPSCGKCKYQAPTTNGDRNAVECRRYPPVSVPFVNPQGQIMWGSGWTARSLNDWCGEYIPKIELQS